MSIDIMDLFKRKKADEEATEEAVTEAPAAIITPDTVELSVQPVRGSSNVWWMAHEAELGLLFVGFNSGAWYSYDDPKASLFEAMLEAESKGKFVNANLKQLPTRKWDGAIEPVQVGGHPFPILDWTTQEVEERMTLLLEKHGDNVVNWEQIHIALPGNSPDGFVENMAAWIQEYDGSPHSDLSLGDEKNLGWVGNVEFHAIMESADEEVVQVDDDEEEEEPAEETPKAKARGKNPRWQRRAEGREWQHYAQALMSCAASFQKKVGVEPTAFLPYDAPQEVRELLEEAGFNIHTGNDLPPVGAVAVGIVKED